MNALCEGDLYTGVKTKTSNSGNIIIKEDDLNKEIVVKTNTKNFAEGAKIKCKIIDDHGDHYYAEPLYPLKSLSAGDKYTAKVVGSDKNENPIINENGLDKCVVVQTDKGDKYNVGDTCTCIILREEADRYIADHTRPVENPDYSGEPNIPLHHDGKHGQSVGETRKPTHATKSPDERDFDPTTKGAPELNRNPDEEPKKPPKKHPRRKDESLERIAEDIFSDK